MKRYIYIITRGYSFTSLQVANKCLIGKNYWQGHARCKGTHRDDVVLNNFSKHIAGWLVLSSIVMKPDSARPNKLTWDLGDPGSWSGFK